MLFFERRVINMRHVCVVGLLVFMRLNLERRAVPFLRHLHRVDDWVFRLGLAAFYVICT